MEIKCPKCNEVVMNDCSRNPEYPQTMYIVKRFRLINEPRCKEFHKAIQEICGKHGHEWSKTDWGYHGTDKVDVWCRWCDFFTQISIDEAIKIWPHIQPLYEQGLTEEALGESIEEMEAPDE